MAFPIYREESVCVLLIFLSLCCKNKSFKELKNMVILILSDSRLMDKLAYNFNIKQNIHLVSVKRKKKEFNLYSVISNEGHIYFL